MALVTVVFLLLAVGAVTFAANVVLRRNPATCAVHLVGAFFCLSGIYLLIGFPFLAAIQLMVYAGAIMVLFLFVIMLLDLRREEPRETPIASLLAPLLAAAILGLVVPLFPDPPIATATGTNAADGATAAVAGRGMAEALFGRHVIAFEATSLLLLTGILGVVVLAKRRARRRTLLDRLDQTPPGSPPAEPRQASELAAAEGGRS